MQYRVLVIDDDEDLLYITQKSFQLIAPTFEIIPATSAQEGLRIIAEDNIDAILCDFHLGSNAMNGLELLEWLREEGNSTPFIIFTGRSREEVAIQALNLGADYYLEKSSDMEGLFSEIAHHIKKVVKGRKTEEALILSEQSYRTLIQSIHETIFVVNDIDCIEEIHSYNIPDLGPYSSKFLNKHVTEIFPEVIYEPYLRFATEVRASNSRREFEFSLRPNEQATWYSARMDLHENGTSIVVSINDITERMQALQALRESEIKVRTAFEDAPFGFALVDFSGPILQANHAFCDMLGYTKDEISKMRFSMLSHPDDRSKTPSFEDFKFEDGIGKVQLEKRYLHKDGTTIWANVHSTIAHDDKGVPLYFITQFEDITERKRYEHEILTAQKRWRETFDSIPDFVSVHDINYVIQRANSSFLEFLGKDKEEVIGKKCYEILHQTNEPPESCPHQKTLTMKQAHTEVVIDPRLGCPLQVTTSPIFDESNAITGVVHIARDITQKTLNETALKDSEEKYRNLVENSLQGIAIIQGGRYVYSNPVYSTILETTQEDLETLEESEVWAYIHPEDIPELKESIDKLESLEIPSFNSIFRVITKMGLIKWVDSHFQNCMFHDNPALQIFGIDITENYLNELEILEKQSNLLKLFDSIGEFVWVVDYDGTIIEANETVVKVLGYSMEEVRGAPAMNFHPEELREEGTRILQRMMEGKETICPLPLLTKDGRHLPVETRFNPGTWSKRNVLIAVSREVTPMQVIDDEDQKYRSLCHSINDIIFVFDHNMTFKEVYSNNVNELYIPPKQFIGKDVSTILPESIARPFSEIIHRVNDTSQPESFEYMLPIQGQERWWEAMISKHESGTEIVAVIRDISERKRIENELREQRQYLINVIESLPHPFYVINATDYTVKLANKHAGSPLTPGITCHLLTHDNQFPCGSDKHPCPLEVVKRTKEPIVTNHLHLDMNGELRDIEVHGYPILDEDGNVEELIEYCIDITDYKRALSALEASEERFRELFEKAPLGYQTLDDEGYIIDVNIEWLEILGYDRNEVIGNHFEEFMGSSSKSRFQSTFSRFISEGVLRDTEIELIKKDGTEIIARFNGRIAYTSEGDFKQTHCIFQDITDWKKAESLVRFERDRAQSYLNLVSVIIIALDTNGNITLLNRKGCETAGYTENEVIGLNWIDHFIPESSRNEVRKVFQEIVHGNIRSYEHIENRIVDRHGNERQILWYNSLLKDEAGNIIGTLSAGEDITERKLADNLLKRQNEELSELAHIMSHDLGNKMTAIASLVGLLKREYDEEILDRISSIAYQSANLLKISAELADAGIILQQKESVDLEIVAREIASTFLPAEVTFITKNLLRVNGSSERIGQIFQNLFRNSIEHGEATEILVEGRTERNGYCLYISNDGKPIPQEIRNNIFQKGFTTKDNGKGLGLSIVKKLVAAHGWRISLVDSERTTFRICTNTLSEFTKK